jgi:voltage-gated potassium channel
MSFSIRLTLTDTVFMQKISGNIKFTPVERLSLALALLLAVVGLGVFGFVVIGNRGFIDSLYMTLVTISTLGMQASDSPWINTAEKLWIIFLIIVGIASAMISLSIIVGIVVEGHVRGILGRRKVNIKIASLNKHIIVCGYGRMGSSTCSNLQHRKEHVVVIDQDNHNTAQAEQDGFLYVLGDASDETILRSAGIERARGLITVLDTDAANVFVSLIARDLNPKIHIVARAEKAESESRLIRAGANKAICPHEIGATRLANILTRPGVVDFIDFATQGLDLEAEQFRIQPESKLVGQSLSQANLPRTTGALIIALKRSDGTTVFNPHADTILQVNDVMFVTGQRGSMEKLQQQYS